MKRLLFLALLCGLAAARADANLLKAPTGAVTPPCTSGVCHVQGAIGASSGTGTPTSVSVTLPAPLGSGNHCVVGVFVSQATSTMATVSDGTNTYIANNFPQASNIHWQLFYLSGVTAGPQTITATISPAGPNHMQIMADEYSGCTNVAHGEQNQQTSPGPGTDAVASLVAATDGPNYLVWGVEANGQPAVVPTAGTGFTIRVHDTTTTEWALASEDRIQATAGSFAATFTNASAGSVWNTGVLTLAP